LNTITITYPIGGKIKSEDQPSRMCSTQFAQQPRQDQ
jgi:hypothetical protein